MPHDSLSAKRLEHAFDERTFARGAAYQAEGHVLSCERETTPTGAVYTGRVFGSGDHIYEVYARVDDAEIEGDCTCPVGYNCKHVVALLLRAIAPDADDTAPASAEPAPEANGGGRESYPEGVDDRLLYLLEVSADGRRLVLHPARVRLRAGGHYGDPSPFAPRRAWEPFPARYLLKSDLEILRTLVPAGDPGTYPDGIPLPADAHGLLRRMLQSSRCHLERADTPPLHPAEPRPGQVGWQLQADGSQRLAPATEPPGMRVLPLSPPWYADPESGACGPLELSLPAAVWERLLTTSPVRPEATAAVAGWLEEALPEQPAARPQVVRMQAVAAQPPVPHLHLYGAPVTDATGEHPVPAARLAFDYAGHRLAWNDPGDTLALPGGEVLRVARDAREERRAVRRLAQMQLHPLSTFKQVRVPPEHLDSWAVPHRDLEPEIWLTLQEQLPQWEADGWRVSYGEGFGFRVLVPEGWYGEVEEGSAREWFDLELGVEVGEERISLLPLLLEWIKRAPGDILDNLDQAAPGEILPLRVDRQRIIHLPVERVRGILGILVDLFDPQVRLAGGRLHLPSARAAELVGLEEAGWDWQGNEELRRLARRLRNFSGVAPVPVPEGFRAELRPYQQSGLDWLQFLRDYGLGGILADDMGLGKTVQALAHLLVEKRSGRMDRPSLVIAPTSLMFNWRAEAARFAPELKVLVLHGPERRARFRRIADHDLVLTTYPLLARDFTALSEHDYHLLVLDEAQAIKNPQAKVSQQVRDLEARHRLCLTGTPMENHLGELWSLFDFLMPGVLGSRRQYRRLFRTPIERDADEERRNALSRRIQPFFLRRTKAQVAEDLPPKSEIVRTTALEGPQRDLYETIRLAMHQRVRQALAEQGMARSHIIILDALLKLRQVCCDPRLLKGTRRVRAGSAKLEMLMELLPEMLEEGRRVLLFSQFTSMLALIEQELKALGIAYVKLTGQTRDRATPVQRFQNGEVPLFLISLKAGGTGLNLTAADTVIHYDPWWNPAVEDQATDRAHRIGQRNKVFVYRLLTEGTVEEKIQRLQAEKRGLVESLLGGKDSGDLGPGDLEALFEPLG